MRGYIVGLEPFGISGSGFSISAGECYSGGDLVAYGGGVGFDISKSFGDGDGCRIDATVSDGTWFLFLISSGVDSAVIASKSSSPTPPVGFEVVQYIGSLLRVSGTLVPFKQTGNRVKLDNVVRSHNVTNPGAGAVSVPLCVPTGISVMVFGTATIRAQGTSGTRCLLLSDLAQPAQAPTFGVAHTVEFDPSGATGGTLESRSCRFEELTDTNGQIRAQLDNSTNTTVVEISTHGWYDFNRGSL